MVDTGWKHPQTVAQDNSNYINSGKEYAFVNLDNIKLKDYSYADQQPHSKTGIDLKHKSPYVYAYNYGFNIPSNATVNRIAVFPIVQQLTHPKKYYENKVGKRRYSISKFCNVRLKIGASVLGEGNGNNMSSKCNQPMLVYKEWSTESQTTFSGSPSEWGLTTKNVVSTINSGNFGVVLQFVGTVDQGWCNPGIAQVRMKVEYSLPALSVSTPTAKSEFTRITVTAHNTGAAISFTNNVSSILSNLAYNDYSNPFLLDINFYHKGLAGETPIIVFESDSLRMGANANSYADGKTNTGKYTMNSLHCGSDSVQKVYTQTIAIFPGILLGEQTVKYTLNGVRYSLRFNVVATGLSDSERAKFMNMYQQCMIKNCLFYNNHAVGYGGANCITSEFYLGSGNLFGRGVNVNRADNKYKENGGKACPDTCWLGECKTGNNGG